jgi:diacylglycerol kinase (ATP)
MENSNINPLLRSFGYAFEGLFYAIRYNRNLKIHLGIGLIVVLASIFLQVTLFEKEILGILILLVILSEMINTSIEEMVNLITQEHKKEAKIAKDVGAGMILVAALGAAIIGVFIFTPYILKLFY